MTRILIIRMVILIRNNSIIYLLETDTWRFDIVKIIAIIVESLCFKVSYTVCINIMFLDGYLSIHSSIRSINKCDICCGEKGDLLTTIYSNVIIAARTFV